MQDARRCRDPFYECHPSISYMKKITIILKENEEKMLPYIWINGEEPEVSYDVQLVGEGARVILIGVFLGTAKHTVVFNTNVVHEAPNTKSLTTIRGVFKDYASFTNDGMVRITNGAKNADGYFSSKILLFDDAKGRSVPSLEIDENELKAGHASTIGRPDEEQLFYMRSRGLTEKEAEKLLIAGFFEPVVQLLPQEEQHTISKQIAKFLR